MPVDYHPTNLNQIPPVHNTPLYRCLSNFEAEDEYFYEYAKLFLYHNNTHIGANGRKEDELASSDVSENVRKNVSEFMPVIVCCVRSSQANGGVCLDKLSPFGQPSKEIQ